MDLAGVPGSTDRINIFDSDSDSDSARLTLCDFCLSSGVETTKDVKSHSVSRACISRAVALFSFH